MKYTTALFLAAMLVASCEKPHLTAPDAGATLTPQPTHQHLDLRARAGEPPAAISDAGTAPAAPVPPTEPTKP